MITSIEVIDKRLQAIDKVPQLFGRRMAEFAFEIELDLSAMQLNSSSSMRLPLDCFLSLPNIGPDNWIRLPNVSNAPTRTTSQVMYRRHVRNVLCCKYTVRLRGCCCACSAVMFVITAREYTQ